MNHRGREGTEGSDRALSAAVIGAAIEVHRQLGPGLLESVYEACLAREMELRGLRFWRQVDLPVFYRGMAVSCGYRIDFVVEQKLLVELKAVERFAPIHVAQVMTYLKIRKLSRALLINFNVPVLRQGIRRISV
jgi:GxxExxY protein